MTRTSTLPNLRPRLDSARAGPTRLSPIGPYTHASWRTSQARPGVLARPRARLGPPTRRWFLHTTRPSGLARQKRLDHQSARAREPARVSSSSDFNLAHALRLKRSWLLEARERGEGAGGAAR
jgi:hypothetical protein